MLVQGKAIIATGAGSGMGRELVLQLLAKGARVAAVDVSGSQLAGTAELAGPKAHGLATFVMDITNREAVEAVVDETIDHFGAIDGVINNAGIIQPFVTVEHLGYDAIERVMNVNFYGTLYMTKAVLPHLVRRPEAHIVNISSMGGFVPVPGQTIYGASKAAVKLLTEGLASELAGTNVKVTIVFPGAVRTNITSNSGVTMRRPESSEPTPDMPALSAEAAATAILDGIERDLPRVLVGSDAKTMDRLARLSPVRAARLIQEKMKGLLER